EVDEAHQLFDGSLSLDVAKKISGVDEVIDQKTGRRLLQDLAKERSTVYALGVPSYAEYADFTLNPASDNLRAELRGLFDEAKDCRAVLAKLRTIKQPEEIEAMEQAAEISVGAFEIAKSKLSA